MRKKADKGLRTYVVRRGGKKVGFALKGRLSCTSESGPLGGEKETDNIGVIQPGEYDKGTTTRIKEGGGGGGT